jgi:hypothetical protein
MSELYNDSLSSIISDKKWDEDYVLGLFNRAIKEISGIALLPGLERNTAVSTGTLNYVAVPDYQRDLRYCHSMTQNREVKVFGSTTLLFREFAFLNQPGLVVGVAPQGSNLFYQRIPSSPETLQLHYWAKPPVYTLDQEPACIPEHLQEDLLVNFAAWKLYARIEDWTDGAKPNTDHFKNEYGEGVAMLLQFLGPEQSKPPELVDETRLDYA